MVFFLRQKICIIYYSHFLLFISIVIYLKMEDLPVALTTTTEEGEHEFILLPPPLTLSNTSIDTTNITWDTLDANLEGVPIGYHQKLWKEFQSVDL
jgi:hypothetical protein